ncbi:hypothetical protein KVT40_006512 [Elsinoe batatas]|uniref:TPR-like protein n=1 Tax=Elsinoe batatas TaxID=2601811 RepID=A0A8K0KXS9_9PEZI|nr:hypothetical protein KVT40_006512 [Elsinoe batatas]
MDEDDGFSAYPDPSSAYVTPYTSQYDAEYSEHAGPYGDPRHGGLWQAGPGPPVHDGFIIRDEAPEFDLGDDSEDDLRATYARFKVSHILEETPTNFGQQRQSAAGAQFNFGLDDEVDVEEPPDPDFDLPQYVDGNAADIDPDFQMSGDDSDGADSLNMELLEEILEEETTVPPRGRGRGRPRGRGRGRGRGGWKWALKGTEHDPTIARGSRPRGRPRGGRGSGRGKKGRPPGPTQPADPGAEFRELQAKATQKFLAGEYEEAAELARQAVKMNPEVFAAHSLLSEVLQAQGRAKDSLAVLIAGAHTKRDPELWYHVSKKTLDLAGDDPTPESLDAAAYCLSWAIRLNSQDYDARRERLNLILRVYQMTNNGHAGARARNECRHMLKLRPADILVAREHAELAVMSRADSEIKKAKMLYDEAMKLQPGTSVFGVDQDEDEQWNHALIYVGMVERIDGPVVAIQQFKTLARRIQQRQDQTFWDDFDDDREFDFDDESRKDEVEEYDILKQTTPANDPILNPGLPVDMRVKLGLYRLALDDQHQDEALRHFQYLLNEADNVAEVADLFRDVADALKASDCMNEAIQFYEPLQEVPNTLDLAYYTNLAMCYVTTGQEIEAEECFKIVVENNSDDVEARVALAKLYEKQDRSAEALPLITHVIRMGRHDALKKSKITIPKKEIRAEERRREQELQQQAEAEENDIILREAMETAQNSIVDQVIMDIGTEEQLRLREELAKSIRAAHPPPQPRIRRAPRPKSEISRPPKAPKVKVVKPPKPAKLPLDRPRRLGGISTVALERQQKIAEQLRVMKSASERIHANYETMKSCTAEMEMGDEDAIAIWKSAINGMLDEFKACKYHYTGVKEKQIGFQGYGRQTKLLTEMEAMRNRLEQGLNGLSSAMGDIIPDNFHDIHHSTWLDLFCNLALQQAREGDDKACYATLNSAADINIFHFNDQYLHRLSATSLACALHLNDEVRINEVTRHFMTIHMFSPTSYDIFVAAFRFHVGPTTWFNASPTQKFLMRSVKQFDFHNLPVHKRADWPLTKAEKAAMTSSGRKPVGWPGTPDLSPNLLALYGHIMAATQTWTGALNYYFRALAMRPENPTLLLCIGSAYVMGSMKRQSDNRHWMVMQGLGFMGQYKRVRRRMAEEKSNSLYLQEAEFNVARAWHFLGLTHLAIRGYRECLRLSRLIERERETRMDTDHDESEMDVEEYTQEAALALINIYVTTDQAGRARALAEQYLVI